MRHAILGAGGVGGLIGACLAHAGASVTLVVRREALGNYPKQLRLESPFGKFAVDVAVAADVPAVDVLWLTVKATQLEPALTAFRNPDAVRAIVPLLNGIEATAQMVKRNPSLHVIILSMHSDEHYLLSALNAGAKGYLLKGSAEEDLVRAIHSVCRGTPFFSPEITKTMLEDYMRFLQQRNLQDSYDLLTEREKEVLQLLAEGKSNKEVANILDISVYTVDSHRLHLMQKLNLHNTAEIVLYAVRKKVIL